MELSHSRDCLGSAVPGVLWKQAIYDHRSLTMTPTSIPESYDSVVSLAYAQEQESEGGCVSIYCRCHSQKSPDCLLSACLVLLVWSDPTGKQSRVLNSFYWIWLSTSFGMAFGRSLCETLLISYFSSQLRITTEDNPDFIQNAELLNYIWNRIGIIMILPKSDPYEMGYWMNEWHICQGFILIVTKTGCVE